MRNDRISMTVAGDKFSNWRCLIANTKATNFYAPRFVATRASGTILEIVVVLVVCSVLGLWASQQAQVPVHLDGIAVGQHLDEIQLKRRDSAVEGVSYVDFLGYSWPSERSFLLDDNHTIQAIYGDELSVGDLGLASGQPVLNAHQILGKQLSPGLWVVGDSEVRLCRPAPAGR